MMSEKDIIERIRDSYAYGDASESDLIEDLISTREGIILEGFYYTGD